MWGTGLSVIEPERFERMKKIIVAYDKEVLKEGPDWWKKEENMQKMMPNDN